MSDSYYQTRYWRDVASKACELHGQRNCATCYHAPGECEYGACHAPAVRALRYPREVRQLCDEHAKRVALECVGALTYSAPCYDERDQT